MFFNNVGRRATTNPHPHPNLHELLVDQLEVRRHVHSAGGPYELAAHAGGEGEQALG